MMFSHSYLRMVWKEYRAQRALWIALLAGTILLEFLYLFFTRQLTSTHPFHVAAVLSTCYAVSSGAMLFAGEREEETDRLLQALAVSPRILAAGKLTWLLLSVALFILLAFFFAVVVKVLNPETSRVWPMNDPDGLLAAYIQAIPTGLAAGIFASLLTRRIMSALLVGILLLLFCSLVSHNLIRFGHEILNALCALTLWTAGLMMIPRWLKGHLDGSRLALIAEGLPLRFFQRDQLGQFLRWSAVRSTPGSRQFGVLVWREGRAAFPVLLVGLVFNSGIIPAAIYGHLITERNEWLAIWEMFSMVASWFLLCSLGLLAFSGDQRQSAMRFYADHGASPRLIWLAKQLTWLTVLVLLGILTGCLLVQLDMGWVGYPNRRNLPPGQMWRPDLALYCSCLLTIYAVIQCLGMWFRRTLLAAALAFVACCLIFPIHYVLGRLEIPFWFSSGPVIAAGFAASCFTMEGWLKETRNWRHTGIQLAWATIPVLLAGISTFVWRIVEIPWVDPGFDWQAHERKMASFDPEWTTDWQQLIADAMLPKAAREALQPPYLERAQRIADRIESGQAPQIDPLLLLNTYNLRQTYDVLLGEQIQPHVGTETTSLEEQWRALQIAQTFNIYFAGQDLTIDSGVIHEIDNRTLAPYWRAWAQDSRQTPLLLDRLITAPVSWPLANWKNDYVTRRQADTGRNWGREWARRHSPVLHQLIETFPLSLLVEERARLLRLQNWKTSLLSGARPPIEAERMRRWNRTTSFDTNSDDWLEEEFNYSVQRQREQSWITNIIARLEKYRIQHGHYPERLYDLGDDLSTPPDGFRPGEFRYESRGLDRPLVVASDIVLPAGQPVLFRDTNLRTGYPRELSALDRQSYQETPRGSLILKKIDSHGIYWGEGWDQYQRGAQYGGFPKVFHTLENLPEKTNRIKYVRFGLSDQ